MTNINIGTKIRELRKKKGITQEGLASVLSVSPQAVSKWESGLTYPDMEMIPTIAGYFEVSLDMLFAYDVREMKARIQRILKEATSDLYDNTEKYIATMTAALQDYPGNAELLFALLEAYEYDLRTHGNDARLEDMIVLSQKIIAEDGDFVRICEAKEIQAAALLRKGEYERAKEVLKTLPEEFAIRDTAFAFRLTGKDKLNGAIGGRCHHLQGLYRACMEEGDAWFFMDRTPTTFRDYTPADYIPEAMKCSKKGLTVLTAFLLSDRYENPAEQYLWEGMQTFHWSFHLCIAACHKKLGNLAACETSVDEAYRLISVVWKDFEENRDQYMKPFRECLEQYDLAEYIK